MRHGRRGYPYGLDAGNSSSMREYAHAGICAWCQTLRRNCYTVQLSSGGNALTNDLTGGKRDLCEPCRKLAADEDYKVRDANRARIEVLSATAAAIVRASTAYTKKQVRDEFDFKQVTEHEQQLVLTVVREVQWGGTWGPNQDDEGHFMALPFSLHPDLVFYDGKPMLQRGRRSTVGAMEHFWSGVGKVAKAAGVLRKTA